MARGINKVILAGNVGRDPEVKHTPAGMAIANISLATNESRKVNNEWVEDTEWHRVVAFGKQAEFIEKFVTKGSSMTIIGRNQTRKWQDRDGNDRYTTEVILNEMVLSGSPSGGGGQSGQLPKDEPIEKDIDDEIPFD